MSAWRGLFIRFGIEFLHLKVSLNPFCNKRTDEKSNSVSFFAADEFKDFKKKDTVNPSNRNAILTFVVEAARFTLEDPLFNLECAQFICKSVPFLLKRDIVEAF